MSEIHYTTVSNHLPFPMPTVGEQDSFASMVQTASSRIVLFDELNTKAWIDFFGVYELERTLAAENYERATTIDIQTPRWCRFCEQKEPTVTFKKVAHLLSQFLGNRNLLSGTECDNCNTAFGAFESAFASYMAAYRPFSFVHPSKNNRRPKYRQVLQGRQKPLSLLMQRTKPHEVLVQGNGLFEEIFEYSDKANVFKLRAVREPYVALHVYKCLLKMALSSLRLEERDFFKETFKIVTTNGYDEGLQENDWCQVFVNQLYGPVIYRGPVGMLFRKKASATNERYPERVFVLLSRQHSISMRRS